MLTIILQMIDRAINYHYFPIITLLCINVLVGALVVTDYGESWDERPRYQYAENSINAYKGIPGDVEDEKGPFFVMISTLGGNLICSISEDCLISDGRHYINFLSFLLSLFFLYRLNNRFVNKWASFGGTLLFNTQPLLWGHAFMNPKDLPFMAFFIASIDTGFAMADSLRYTDTASRIDLSNNLEGTFCSRIFTDLKSISGLKILELIITTCLVILIIAGFSHFQTSAQQVIEEAIQDVYNNNTQSLLDTIFTRSAQNMNDIPVESYIHKAWQLYLRGVKYLYISLIIFWLFFLAFMIFSQTRIYLWNNQIKPLIKPIWEIIKKQNTKTLLKPIWKNIKNPKVVIAGVFLGLTCSIRTLGPAAGGLISIYLISKYKKHSLPMLVTYGFIGAITTYISWPGLWDSPIQSFMNSFQIASNFPWGGQVLFGGQTYHPGTHPRTYLPVLLSLQFTFTGLFTIILGIILSITNIIRGKSDWKKITILYLWFFVPFVLVIIFEPKIYDNFRHFLFIIPPLFSFASFSIQSVFNIVKRPAIQTIFVILLIVPNLFPLVRLHPYQYVYYNILTDGIPGAFRKYEMDYWGTSFQEAIEFINQFAPMNAKIIISGPLHIIETYARPDLAIERYEKDMTINPDSPSYAILLSRYDKDIRLFPEAEIIYIVGRDHAIFTVVKDLNYSNIPAP